MYSIGIIIFREILEVAIILSVLLAATKGLPHRTKLTMIGLASGILGSILVAVFAQNISKLAQGMGQEIFNALVLLAAAFLIAWTTIWMKKHGKAISQHFKLLGTHLSQGHKPLYTLSIVLAIAMLREGSEMVLFTYGIRAAGESVFHIFLGWIMGATLGIIVGIMLYYGLIKISIKYVFSVTSWLLVFMAAGMISQAIGYLSAADYIPALIEPVWKTSHLLSERSVLGEILHILLGYSEQPSLMQVLAYTLTIITIVSMMKIQERKASPCN